MTPAKQRGGNNAVVNVSTLPSELDKAESQSRFVTNLDIEFDEINETVNDLESSPLRGSKDQYGRR